MTLGMDELERRFAEHFADPEDEARLAEIEGILSSTETIVVDVLPGESVPPEYHVYVRDPREPDRRLFACVLAPEAVTDELLQASPHLLFENATFQAMSSDTSTAGLLGAVETWFRRLFPDLAVPRIVLRPWPIRDVVEDQAIHTAPKKPLIGAAIALEVLDYPRPEELSA